MLFISLILSLSTPGVVTKLKEVITKQSLANVRYIAPDGKQTYFQLGSGELLLGTNYTNQTVYKAPRLSEYKINNSDLNSIAVELDEAPFSRIDFFKNNKILWSKVGDQKLKLIGEGRYPQIHSKDKVISYYSPLKRQIYVKSLIDSKDKYKITLNNKISPYFIPQTIIKNMDSTFFTDINEQGLSALMYYSKFDQKVMPLYKSKYSGTRLDICLVKENLYIGEFSYDTAQRGSSIIEIPLFNNPKFAKNNTIYSSEFDDIGHLKCDINFLYFIKTIKFKKDINLKLTELVKINLKTSKLTVISDLKYVTSFVYNKGTIFIPFREKYFLAQGKASFTNDAIGEKK